MRIIIEDVEHGFAINMIRAEIKTQYGRYGCFFTGLDSLNYVIEWAKKNQDVIPPDGKNYGEALAITLRYLSHKSEEEVREILNRGLETCRKCRIKM